MNPASIINLILVYAGRLRFKYLFFLVTALFIIDMLVPDFIPFIDEIVLGLLAVLLANWKKEQPGGRQGAQTE